VTVPGTAGQCVPGLALYEPSARVCNQVCNAAAPGR